MNETLYDYSAEIEKEGFNTSVKFSVGSVLVDLLDEAQEKLWCEEEVEKIFSDLKGVRWGRKLLSRFKSYKKSRQIVSHVFQNLCTYLGRDLNQILNQGKCAVVSSYSNCVIFDPYDIMASKKHLRKVVAE